MKYYKISRYKENPTLALVKFDEDKSTYYLAKYSQLNPNRLNLNNRFDGCSSVTRAYSKLRPIMNVGNFLNKDNDKAFIVKTDIPFNSPSALASCVLGTNASGPRELEEITEEYFNEVVNSVKDSQKLELNPQPVTQTKVIDYPDFDLDDKVSLFDIVKNLINW